MRYLIQALCKLTAQSPAHKDDEMLYRKYALPYIVNRDFQTPYLAGYSLDGRIVYIDKRLPRFLKLKDGRVIGVDKYLCVHESWEKFYEDRYGYKYQAAHEFATGKEREAVEADGIPWVEYQNYMKRMVRKLMKFTGPLPHDLDLKPERDYHDIKLLEKIKRAMELS